MATLSRRQFSVTDQAGNVVPGAWIEVKLAIVDGQPLATLYQDRAGTVPLGNPFQADANGFFFYHAAAGVQRVRAYVGPSGAPTFEQVWDYVPVGTIDELDYDIDQALAANSDGLIPTQKAIKAYVDNLLGGGGAILINDASFTLRDDGDTTRKAQFQLSGISSGQTRTYTLPDASTVLVGTAIAQTLQNKTIDNSNAATLKDASFTLQDDADATKQAQFQLSGIATGTLRTYTLPNASTTLVGHDATQTLTNKSISGVSNTISALDTTMFAAGVIDTDGNLAANSDTRLATQKAVKAYVDTVAQGLDAKPSVKAATVANITLSGAQTVDGVALVAGDRCLVKNQTTAANNGIYVVAAGAWARSGDFDSWSELPGGYAWVEQGTVNGDTGWTCIVDQGGTLGTTAVTFTQFAGAGTYAAGTGLQLTGTQFSIDATVVTLAGSQTLANKTLSAPVINGGTHSGVTSFGLRSSGSGAFDLVLQNTENLSAARALTLKVNDAARTIDLAGNLTLAGALTTSGSHGLTFALSGGTTATLPQGTPTLVARDSADTLTNKTIDTAAGSGNSFKINGSSALVTAANWTAALNAMTGDGGSGGVKGLVPAPGAGDGAAGKYLDATGAWSVPAGGGGGGGLADVDRQNILLDRIYQSKSFAGYRRFANAFADGYKASDGIAAGSSSNYSVDTSGGKVSPTTSSDTYATTVDPTLNSNSTGYGGYTIVQRISAAALSTNGDKVRLTLAPASSGSNTVINKVYIGKPGTAPSFDGGQVQVTFSGGSAGVTLTAGGATVVSDAVSFSFDHTSDFLVAIEFGATADPRRNLSPGSNYNLWTKAAVAEAANTTKSGYTDQGTIAFVVDLVEVRTAAAAPNNMTLVTTAQTTDSGVSMGRVLIEFDNGANPTLNTDLTAEVTCNGGTNWSVASLSQVTVNGQNNRKVVESIDQACTGGTSFAARIKTLNGKNVPIFGVSLTVH